MEIPIEQGMSYDKFMQETSNLTFLPMLGYVAVANIQGVESKDAGAYFLMLILGTVLSSPTSGENSYTIVDDINTSDGDTINKGESSTTKTIYTSEFGKRVMEYVNDIYKDKKSINDSSDGINSYELTVEKKDVTSTSCKLVSSLSVNLDADFSKLNGYGDKIGDIFLNKDITKENADYVISLKVGQKCRIETTEKITGKELSGVSHEYNQINEKCVEITGKTSGKINGYIYVGGVKKSIFITVEENTENIPLDTVELKIGSVSKVKTPDNNVEEENKISLDTLPKTGEEGNGVLIVLYIIVGTCSIGLLTLLLIKLKKK